MGVAEDWQQRVINKLANEDIAILNPRRPDWDSSWEQTIDNPQFREQVEWELDSLAYASIVLMYFDPSTKSPISLLELGLHAKDDKLVVVCPKGFWRKGNVDILCARYNITQFDTIDEALVYIKDQL